VAHVCDNVAGRGHVLLNGEHLLVGHNVAYDCAVLCAHCPELLPLVFAAYEAGRITDTGIRQQLWDIAMGRTRDEDDALRAYRLSDLVQMIFDRDITAWKGGPDAWRMRYSELHGLPLDEWPEAAVEYPKVDGGETWAVWDAQETKVGHLIVGDAFQSFAAFCLNLMSIRGMRTDPVAVHALKARNLNIMDKLRPELIREGLLQWEGPQKDPRRKLVKKRGAAQARMAATCEAKGIEPLLTQSGRKLVRNNPEVKYKPQYFAVDKAACFWAEDELLLRRAEYVSAEKVVNTYCPPLEKGYDLPVSTRFGMAATTRTTSSAPGKPLEGTNLQNAPRKGGVRECFIPREGMLFMAADFSGAELHCLAQVCKTLVGHSTLGELLKAGTDVHTYVGAALAGTTYEDLKLRVDQGDPEAKEQRQDAKASNFGFGGYMHERTFVLTQLKMGRRYTLERAKFMRDTWLQALPEMPEYFDFCKNLLGPKKDVQIPLWEGGPIRRIKKITTLCNSLFQAPAARGGKGAVIEVAKACYVGPSPLYGNTWPVNYVHDESITETCEASVDELDRRARYFAKTMEDAFNVMVPDYPTTADPVLMRRWYKDAETVTDAKGRIVCWEPKEKADE
jgi:hypothetical protein